MKNETQNPTSSQGEGEKISSPEQISPKWRGWRATYGVIVGCVGRPILDCSAVLIGHKQI